jgi:soluble lytic murein transglycosylase-like protein/TolA-binding protein
MSIRNILLKSFFIIFSLLLLSCFFIDTRKEDIVVHNILIEAREAVENELYIEAFDLYTLLLFFDRSSKEGTMELTLLYQKFREYSKAIETIIQYKKAVPHDTDFDSLLAEMYYRMDEYENALLYLGNNNVSMLKRAICLERTGNLIEAESLYTTLAPSFTEISGFLSQRISYCQVARGVPESIVDLFRKLRKTIKNNDEKYIVSDELLDYFVRNEKYIQALRLVDLMEEDFPKKESILELEKANIFYLQEEFEKAYSLYHTILAEGGQGAYRAGITLLGDQQLKKEEIFPLAQICYNRKDYKNARDLLEIHLEHSKSNYALYLLGMSYYKLRQNRNVVKIFKKLKETYPEKQETIIYYLGRAKEKIGDYASAIKDYKYVSKNKKSTLADNAIYLAALLEEDKGNFDTAHEIYTMMKDEFEKGDYIYKAMLRGGILSYRMKKFKLAKEFFYKAKKLSKTGRSDYVSTLYWLGRVEEKRGKKAKRDSLWNIIKRDSPLSYFSFYLGGKDILVKEENTMKWLSTWTDTTLSLSDEEMFHWQRGEIFLEIGLAQEAQRSFANVHNSTIVAYTLSKLFREKGFDYESIIYSLTVKGRSPGSYFSKAPAELLKIEYPLLYLPTILEKSKMYSVDPGIMVALIHQESAYQRTAVSVANAIGLTQLLPEVAQEVATNFNIEYNGISHLKSDYELSIELGVAHFSDLQRRYENFEIILAAYNAGEAKAKEWKKKWFKDKPTYFDMITYSETRDYVKRVLAKREIYNTLWNLEPKISLTVIEQEKEGQNERKN